MNDLISRQAAIDALDGEITVTGRVNAEAVRGYANLVCDRIKRLPSAQPEKRTEERTETHACDLIDREAAIDVADAVWSVTGDKNVAKVWDQIKDLPSVQPEIIHCKECKYGVQDEDNRWYCRSLGCQIGNEDGSGYCADAERRGEQDG